ncbi:MAG: serine--tRNA ligase [Chloroflexi bacterium]|nr:serine--tRNA ligase [Chloroflexota bacterium]
MLSLELIRKEPELVRQGLASRGEAALLDQVLALDADRRRLVTQRDTLRAEHNALSREIGKLLLDTRQVLQELYQQLMRMNRTLGGPSPALDKLGQWLEEQRESRNAGEAERGLDALNRWLGEQPDARNMPVPRNAQQALRQWLDEQQEAQTTSKAIEALEKDIAFVERQLQQLLLTLPNLPQPAVPKGEDATANRVVRTWGEPRRYDFEPLPHWELGERLGLLDLERGAQLAGSRFFVLRGAGARLQRALIAWMLDVHTREHGYTEFYLPYLVHSEALVGAGNLPKFGDNLYRDAEEDLWLVPTAETGLTNLHRDEILSSTSLPLYYVAHTPCFRREKAAAGKDTRGIKRVHQFEKVELYKLVEPERSDGELEKLVGDAEEMLQRLELPYRVVQLCTGDLGFQSAGTYDLEVWAPGCGEWLEVSSCSTCTDFQARRANIRYRPAEGARPQFVHTLNGSGLALPRTIIAVLESYQQADGSVVVPNALRPYMGMDVIR